MRLLFSVMFLLLVIGLLVFAMTNLGTTVPVTIWSTEYADVHIFYVVVASFFIGAVFTAVLAVAEGTKNRLENRRLRREVHRLETELNYQRTQPSLPTRPEPDELEREPAPSRAASSPSDSPPESPRELPSAPVYGPGEGDDWPRNPDEDPDDDAYSGGRAV